MRILLFSLHFYQRKALKYEIFSSFAHFVDNIVAHPGARTWCHACRGGRCAAAILSDRSSSADNKYKIL